MVNIVVIPLEQLESTPAEQFSKYWNVFEPISYQVNRWPADRIDIQSGNRIVYEKWECIGPQVLGR